MKHAHLFEKLPCQVNCQFPVERRRTFEFCLQCFEDAKILHFNYKNKNLYLDNSLVAPFEDQHSAVLSFYSTLDGYIFRQTNTKAQELVESGSTISPKLLKLCETFISNRKFRTHLFFWPFDENRTEIPKKRLSTFDVTLVTQLSFDRLHSFEQLAASWQGTISAAVYIAEAKMIEFLTFWTASTILSTRRNIALHISKSSKFFSQDASFQMLGTKMFVVQRVKSIRL